MQPARCRTGFEFFQTNVHAYIFIDVGAIQCLDTCKRLQTLVLHSNAIDTIANLECCRELWNIDLAGNKV